MNNIEVYSQRGTGNTENIFLLIDETPVPITFRENYNSKFNIRYIFEYADERRTYNDQLLGELKDTCNLDSVPISENSNIAIINESNNFKQSIKALFLNNLYKITCSVYIDKPVHDYQVLKALPIPTNILTFYFVVSEQIQVINEAHVCSHKYFDGFSHLGFMMTDLSKMQDLIHRHYGNKELDLVQEFSNTNLVDKLFAEGILIITWGINSYTYPIFSVDAPNCMLPILGEPFEFEGNYKIDSKLNKLSIVPGHMISKWPQFLNEDFPLIELYGKGENVVLKPYRLKDEDSEITISSFLLYRTTQESEHQPLINVNLL